MSQSQRRTDPPTEESSLEAARWTRRQLLERGIILAGASAGAAFLSACAPTGQPAVSTPRAVKGGNVIEGWTEDVNNLNPNFSASTSAFTAINLLFDGLMSTAANGDLIPILASGLPTISQDQRTMTFRLRSGVKWTDGRELTADDVVFTYRVYSAPEYIEAVTPRRGDMDRYLESVTSPDPQTVAFKFKTPWAPFAALHTSYGIVPKHILGSLTAKELNTAAFNTNPTVTNGQFKFVRLDKGDKLQLARNETYHRGAPNLDGYTLRVLGNAAGVATALQTGEIDMGVVDPNLADQLRSLSHLTLTDYMASAVIMAFYQLDPAKPGSKFFSDKRVRQGLLYALDREKMSTAIFRGAASPAHSTIPAISWAYNPNVSPKYGFDKTKAEQLLDAAGWMRGATGVREKDGSPMRFEIMGATGNKPLENTVVSIQEQWKAVGVEATPKMLETNALTDQWRNKRQFDVLFTNVNFPVDPDPSVVWSASNAAQGGLNAGPYLSTEANKLLDEGASVFDVEARKKTYVKFQDLFAEDLPAALLFVPKEIQAVNKRVQGIVGVIGTHNRFRRPWYKDVFVTDKK
jgi:peptide/nickel transport system substrate-binding protein